MRLYPKNLYSVKDLQREKRQLKKANRKMDKDDFLSLNGIMGRKKDKEKKKDQPNSLVDFLPISNPLVATILKIAERRVLSRRPSFLKGDVRKPGKSMIATVAVEFIGGYLKWKAIEFGYRQVKGFIEARRNKKRMLPAVRR